MYKLGICYLKHSKLKDVSISIVSNRLTEFLSNSYCTPQFSTTFNREKKQPMYYWAANCLISKLEVLFKSFLQARPIFYKLLAVLLPWMLTVNVQGSDCHLMLPIIRPAMLTLSR